MALALISLSPPLAANDDTEDNTPLSKLGALKKEDNAHLQLMNQAKGFAAKLDSLRLPDFLDDDASFILELPDDRHGIREELGDLRTLLELNPFDESKALRRVKLLGGDVRRATTRGLGAAHGPPKKPGGAFEEAFGW